MHFTYTPLSLVFSCISFSASISAQGQNQDQTCDNACTVAQACNDQCVPAILNSVEAAKLYIDCLCQSGCLCNAEICLQCCDATSDNAFNVASCGSLNFNATNVLDTCGIVSRPFSFSRAHNPSRGDNGPMTEDLHFPTFFASSLCAP